MRVLIIKDEEQTQSIMEHILVEEGYAIDYTYNVEEGLYFAENVAYDLIIISVCYPRKESIEICQEIRSKKIGTPILILTNKSSVRDRVKWLNAGADDVFIYPFAIEELQAKISNLLSREGLSKSAVLKAGNIVINTATKEVYKGEECIQLNKKEYLIFEYLMHNPNTIITRAMIQDHVWGIEYDSEENLVEVYICRLRQKLNKGEKLNVIQTVRGMGYRLNVK